MTADHWSGAIRQIVASTEVSSRTALFFAPRGQRRPRDATPRCPQPFQGDTYPTMFRPFRARSRAGFWTQGGATRLCCCALLWADLYTALSGRRGPVGRGRDNSSGECTPPQPPRSDCQFLAPHPPQALHWGSRAFGAVASALPSHGRGHRFDPCNAHLVVRPD